MSSSDEFLQIDTPENVVFGYEVAGIGSRFMVAMVDHAAILVMQVGKERAAPILRSMREQEVAEIMSEVARLHHLELHEIEEVMGEFRDTFIARAHVAQGGYQTARELLESSFGAFAIRCRRSASSLSACSSFASASAA